MALKDWKKHLPDGFYLVIRMETLLGKIVDFAVVLVFEEECITRYDSSHGYVHRDILGRREGLIKKESNPNMTFGEGFSHALNDISSHYREYFEFYDSH
jgi:hypothetical protein